MRSLLVAFALVLATAAASVAAEADGAVRLYIGGYGSEIRWFRFGADGSATEAGHVASPKNPSFLALAPAGDRLYAVSEGGGGRVAAFAVAADGGLKQLSDAGSGGNGPCHVAVDPSGRWVFAANYGSGHVAVLPVTDAGVGEPVAIDKAGENAHMAMLSPDGSRLLVPCLGSDHIATYRFDAKTGAITRDAAATWHAAPKAGPRHLAFHPTLSTAYVIDELDDTLVSAAWDAGAGTLTTLGTVSTLPAGFDGAKNSCAHVLVHPSGRFVYGSNRGHDSIAVFALDAKGVATPAGHATGDGAIRKPRDFALDPTGRWLVVANQDGADLAVFAIDQTTGALTLHGRVPCAGAPTCVLVAR